VFGDNLFNMDFFKRHEAQLDEVYSWLADEPSRQAFRSIIEYKLSGDISFLDACESDEETTARQLLRPETIKSYADLGAYNGDTIKRLLPLAPALSQVVAMEPDRRNFRKLSEYAATLSGKIDITPLPLAAWDKHETLLMDASGNRNANLSGSGKKTVEVEADALDNVIGTCHPDYIKYDVEGSEKQALEGSRKTIAAHRPRLLVSLYHRSEDLFALPALVREIAPHYKLYLRKLRYIPAWDVNLYAIPDGSEGDKIHV
jgi:FkbM family methyltransferase